MAAAFDLAETVDPGAMHMALNFGWHQRFHYMERGDRIPCRRPPAIAKAHP
jgi:hypothetical protein